MSTRAAAEAARLRAMFPMGARRSKTAQAIEIEKDGWRKVLSAVFPEVFDTSLIDDHVDFWNWGWKFICALRDNTPLPEDEGNAFLALWSRNFGKSTHAEVFTALAVCVVGFGIFLYVAGTQDLANGHLSNVEALLISDGVRRYYPEQSRPKKSEITNQNRSWSQKKIETDGGAVVQAIGLNVGVRGLRKGKDRVRGFVLDDVDDYDDSPQVALDKADTLGSSVLPTSDINFFVIGAQNLITEHSVFNRIYTKADKMLAHRVVSGPHPAFDELETEFIDGRDIITHSVPRWPQRVSQEVGQRFIDTFGLPRFLAEFQHQFDQKKEGLVLKNYRDELHVIRRSDFARIFGTTQVPDAWYKYAFNDWSKTKSQYHANVAGKVTVSSQNSALPGRIFLYDLMSFPAQTEPEDVAVRFLKSLTPQTAEMWDEIVRATLTRAELEKYVHNTTKLIEARREVLADVIPQMVSPILEAQHFLDFRMSHEAKTQKEVYSQVFGLPFMPMNPGEDGGVDWINHYMKVMELRKHPFLPEKDGEPWLYLIVEDEKYDYPTDALPDHLHDSDLARYQFTHWRWRAPKLNEAGVMEYGPMKMNDDFGNGLMMLFVDNCIQAVPMTKEEKLIARLPDELKPSAVKSKLGTSEFTDAYWASEHAQKLAREQVDRESEDLARKWRQIAPRAVRHR